MKALVTGMNGTVAPAVARALADCGHVVIPWDRSVVPIDNRKAVADFIDRAQADWFFHIATGSPDWAELVAQLCAERGVKLLFTSSVSVFSAAQSGPFTVDHPPTPADDYGRYKFECEQRVRAASPAALVVRLGWQIGTTPGGNHMLDYLERSFQATGWIDASIHWYQACSFLADTAQSLVDIMQRLPAGLYHVDGNPGLNFYEIVVGLNRLHGNRWVVNPSTMPVQNNRLVDLHIQVQPITRWFQDQPSVEH